MEAEGEPAEERCALRAAEKAFRRARSPAELPPHIDFGRLKAGDAPAEVALLPPVDGVRIFALPRGLFVLRGLLSADEQLLMAQTALNELARPPHRTNLYIYEEAYRSDPNSLHAKARGYAPEKYLVADEQRFYFNTKIRWANIGRQYDWDHRQYLAAGATAIPADLQRRAVRAAELVGLAFEPQAGIINFYGQGDCMSAHLDDGEPDQSRPIVSFSLGLSCIFLLGGRTRSQPPLPMCLDSGDVCIMSGESRRCFHGVPKILADTCEVDAQWTPPREEAPLNSLWHARNYLRSNRINLNFRQVDAQPGG